MNRSAQIIKALIVLCGTGIFYISFIFYTEYTEAQTHGLLVGNN